MRKGIVIDAEDIKKMLAEKFGVTPDKVIKSQYTYTVITDDEPEKIGRVNVTYRPKLK